MKILSTLTGILATKYTMDAAGVEEFIGGLISGLVKKDDLPEIQKCLANSESLEVEITNALSDLAKGDIQDVIKGIQELGQILKELPVDLKDCEAISEDVAKIEAWGQIFLNPVTLMVTLTKNLLANWSAVYTDIEQTNSDYNAAKYYNTGEDIADILVLSVGKISASQAVE